MGLFDTVRCSGEEFKCSEGHDVSGENFQTKDLYECMGTWALSEELTPVNMDDWWGKPPDGPFSGRIYIYSSCPECPAFVQAITYNFCACPIEFEVEISKNKVLSIVRVSQPTSEWLEEEPKKPYMKDCLGPMSYEEAYEIHSNSYKYHKPKTE